MFRPNPKQRTVLARIIACCIGAAVGLTIVANMASAHDCMRLNGTKVCVGSPSPVVEPCEKERDAIEATVFYPPANVTMPDDASHWTAEVNRYAWMRYARCLEREIDERMHRVLPFPASTVEQFERMGWPYGMSPAKQQALVEQVASR